MPKYGSYQSLSAHRANIEEHNRYRDAIRGQQLTISVGPRYVFFNSLAAEHSYVYLSLYGQAKSYVAQVTSQLKSFAATDATGQQISRMQAYVNFISQMAGTEGENLKDYLEKMKTKLQQGGNLPDELEKKFNIFFKNFQETGGANYLQMIALINDVMQKNNQNQETIDQMYRELGNTIDNAIQKVEKAKKETQKNEQETLTQLFHTNIQQYNKQVNKIMKEALKDADFKINYARLMAKNVNGVLAEIINKGEFLNIIETIFINASTSIDHFSQQLLSFIIQQLASLPVEQLLSKSYSELTNVIIEKLSQNGYSKLAQVNTNFISLIENQFEKRRANKTLEEIVLTTGKGTARIFSQLTNKQDIINTYLADSVAEQRLTQQEFNYIQEFARSPKFTKGKLAYATKILNKGIGNKLKTMLTDETINQLRNKQITIDKILTTVSNIPSALASALSVKISGPNMGEVLTGAEFINNLTLSLQSGGHKVKLKNDINVIINFNEEKFSQNARTQTALKDIAISLQTGFIDKYVEVSRGAEDVQAAEDAYLEQLREVKKRIDELVKRKKISKKKAKAFLESLKNMTQVGISVKDYAAGNNLGFHGGTLGANLEAVVNNIENMYQLGGISKMDTDMLYFAIANCSPDAVAFGLKESIETYLAGAAAIMMFDQGFTTATAFMDKMKQQLGGFDSMKTVHLFRVQGKLIPAAVVYGTIASNLSSIIGQLQANVQAALQSGGNFVHINNNISRNNIPSFYNVPNPQDRWDAVSSLAGDVLSGSNISFTFLGGVIDILNAIPSAFNL